MRTFSYLTGRMSRRDLVRSVVLLLLVLLLTFAVLLSKCSDDIRMGARGKIELAGLFISSLSSIQYNDFGLFPAFSAAFLLLANDTGFEREMFILKKPEKISRLVFSRVLLSCGLMTTGAMSGLILFWALHFNECEVTAATVPCVAAVLVLFLVSWTALGFIMAAMENFLSKPLAWLLVQVLFIVEVRAFMFCHVSFFFTFGLLIPAADSFGPLKALFDLLVNVCWAACALVVFSRTLDGRGRML